MFHQHSPEQHYEVDPSVPQYTEEQLNQQRIFNAHMEEERRREREEEEKKRKEKEQHELYAAQLQQQQQQQQELFLQRQLQQQQQHYGTTSSSTAYPTPPIGLGGQRNPLVPQQNYLMGKKG